MSTFLNSLEVAARVASAMRLGLALRHWFHATRRTVSPEGILGKIKPEAKRRAATALRSNGPEGRRAWGKAAAGVNQPVLNLSFVLPTNQLEACEALWVNQSRLDFTASNNTFG
jgi:hypothetical protein